jgi:putative inorganic carbon (HCO3(-)) transporter
VRGQANAHPRNCAGTVKNVSFGSVLSPGALPDRPSFQARAARLRTVAQKALPFLAFVGLVLLVHHFDAPVALAAALLVTAAAFLMLRPELATLLMVFLLYTNIPVLAYKYHGVPQVIAGAFMLLLFIPLGHYLIVKRQRARIDAGFYLMLLFLAVLLLTSMWARGPKTASDRIQTYLLEGVLLYWLIINVIRGMPTLRRVIGSLLVAGSLLGGLSLYQEVTGSFDQQFGGLAHRNYEFMTLERALEMNPGDPVLRELKASMRDDRSRRAEGPMDEPNAYGQMMLVLLPLALYMYRTGKSPRARLFGATAGALIFGGMVISQSRGALVALALIVAVAAYLRWIRPAHLLVPVLALVILTPLVASDQLLERISSITTAADALTGSSGVDADPAIQGRATEMMAAFQVVLDYPVLGVGPGQYAPYYSIEYHQKNPRFKFKDLRITRRAHSLYLELAAEYGLVGLGVFLSIVFVLMRDLLRARKRLVAQRQDLADLAIAVWLSLCAYLAAGIFLHLMYERYFWILVALASAALHAIRSEEALTMDPTRSSAVLRAPQKSMMELRSAKWIGRGVRA